MAIPSRACHVITVGLVSFLISLAGCLAGVPLPAGPDKFRGANVARHFKADPSEKIFNVLSFGAKADGRKDNTQVNQLKNNNNNIFWF